jgi:hypothetical protein
VLAVNVAVPAEHTLVGEDVTATVGVTVFTTIFNIAGVHPFPRSYEIVVNPFATPDTTPPVEIVAALVFELDHVPPETVLLNVTVDPTQTLRIPDTGPGA